MFYAIRPSMFVCHTCAVQEQDNKTSEFSAYFRQKINRGHRGSRSAGSRLIDLAYVKIVKRLK